MDIAKRVPSLKIATAALAITLAALLALSASPSAWASQPAGPDAELAANATSAVSTQEELAAAIEAANAASEDAVIKLTGDIEVTGSGIIFTIQNANGARITVDGDDGNGGRYAISGNVGTANNVSKMFAVYTDASFENVDIVNSGANGRCIDTRAAVDLTLDNVSLAAQGSGNTQPLTIGGSENGTSVTMTASRIDATPAGYGIIVFVKSDIAINQGSNIAGYAAVYMKSGSGGSTVSVSGSSLHGDNIFDGTSSNFGTVAVEASDIALDVVDSSVTANATGEDVQALFSVSAQGLDINVEGASELTYEGNSRVFNYSSGFGATDVSMGISGGTFAVDDSFTEEMLKAYLVDGATASPIENGLIRVTPTHNCPSAGFEDVDQSAWYHEAVDFAVENGLMGVGTEDKFMPLENANRAMFVTVLWRYAGEPAVDEGATTTSFPDVKQGAWYYDAVMWATSKGIVSGYTDGPDKGKFGPDDGIGREQMAVILHRFATGESGGILPTATSLDSFPDADKVSSWALSGMEWAVDNGIITGVAGKYLDPTSIAQRAQVATVIQRLDSLMES